MNPRAAQHRDSTKFCAFHNGMGHTTEECLALRRAIEKLSKEGHLQQYRADAGQNRGPDNANNNNNNGGPRRMIGTITEQPSSIIQLKHRLHDVKKIYHVTPSLERDEKKITFSRKELVTNPAVMEQPISLTAGIDCCDVRRVLVDTGATKDILYYECFRKLQLSEAHLQPYPGKLEGFTNHKVSVKGTITLEVTLGHAPTACTK